MTKSHSSTRSFRYSSFGFRHSDFVIRRTAQHGFTFVEILAALTFLAILVPTLMSAMSTSNRMSVMAERGAIAGQLAENKLNELLVDNSWATAEMRGDFGTDYPGYRWELSQGSWNVDTTTSAMTELTLKVFFTVQGHEHSIQLSTLASQQLTSPSATTSQPTTAQ